MENRYAIYEEYDGRQRFPINIRLPKKIVEAMSLRDAVNAFSLSHNLEIVRYAELPEDDVRVWFRRTNLLGQSSNFGYYFRMLKYGELSEEKDPFPDK
ncbi:hypothetical protein NIE88_17495 [Sporolactobacillus shoreicorticis]|uniref:Uncharacterized protein n=1 Tax=Sporolactobacillus shoreicorticis TaxID=1923877 RepID=A0ABW5S4B0_9BACL|nr:hypothetical protein [Sporolactobacillus shoreicorticis]MCO7127554.1 hypothetical protein [Sporolactobacillus shoreicorticis]